MADTADRFGRYVVLERLGAGTSGVVLAAYDPQLDRRVAIKVLRVRNDARDAELRERVLREARVLARLVHPNVIAIHDAGNRDKDLFVVMELVDGMSLKEWLRTPRDVEAVRGVFVQAGRGLAAAHATGVIHRDFKPANVLVGHDGRVRVADFGLAVVERAENPGAVPAEAIEDDLTQTGMVVGTPAYMAPEQHAGTAVDARADQFAFCVALHEALVGERPFREVSYPKLAASVRLGRMQAFPASAGKDVPAWLRAIVLRGLATGREDRFASMDALLAVLAIDPATRRRRRLQVMAAAMAIVALSVAAVAGRVGRPSPCRGAVAEAAAVWNEPARARVRAAFEATRRTYAAGAYAAVGERIDRQMAGWVAMRTDACEATHLRGTQSQEALDLRMRCLDQRLQSVGATVTVLEAADGAVVDRAPAVAASLESVAGCADLEALAAAVPMPREESERKRIEELRGRLAAAQAEQQAGRYRQAVTTAAVTVEQARALGYRPLLAAALRTRGSAEKEAGDVRSAETTLREALAVATASGEDDEIARTSVALAALIGTTLGRTEDLKVIAPLVEALLARRGTDELRAEWLTTLGVMEVNGAQKLERALAMQQGIHDADHPAVLAVQRVLASARRSQGRFEEARRLDEDVLRGTRRTFGDAHPEVATAMISLAAAIREEGRHAEALELYLRALEMRAALNR